MNIRKAGLHKSPITPPNRPWPVSRPYSNSLRLVKN
jgi:hypothetical protein